MTVPIRTAADHPRFSGDPDATPPLENPRKKIDTEAARERVTAARKAEQASDKPSDKPPTRRKPTRDEATRPTIPYTNGMFKAPITVLYGQVGNVVSYVAYPLGQTITAQAGACGEAWDHVAKQNPKVARWLHSMTRTGAWGELFAAHLPILMTTLVLFGPDSFKERMGMVVADSIDTIAAEQPTV